MKSVITSIQPYYVFLIIAHHMGWNIPQEKTVEVRKDFPKDPAWNKTTHIYCSKNRKSFNRIPKQYQPFMAKLLGKVIGEFECDNVYSIKRCYSGFMIDDDIALTNRIARESCLDFVDLQAYLKVGNGYGWHISDLKIYDRPKELGEFTKPCPEEFADKYDCSNGNKTCKYFKGNKRYFECCEEGFTRPPQSWCYVEE